MKNGEARAQESSKVSTKEESAAACGSKSQKRSIDSISSNDKLKHSLVAAAYAGSASANAKKVKSVQDDPNASSVYKSLFTSSEKAKNQQKAHWVTFNPQYF